VHKTVGVLRQVLAMAVNDNRLSMNPVDGIELPPVTEVEQRFLTLDQLHQLATAAGVYKSMVYVLGTCGLRFGEVAELRWRDLDIENLRLRISRSVTLVDGVFEVGPPKNDKSRSVAIPAFVADLVQPGDPDGLVFPDSNGGYMRGSNVRRRWWSQAVATVQLFPRITTDAAGNQSVVHGSLFGDPGRREHQGVAEHVGPQVRGAHVGPLRAPVRVRRRGCRGRHQRLVNS
jgi:integrase